MQCSPYIAYFDECGDHGLATINPTFPVFVLCAAVFRIEDYRTKDAPALSAIKFRRWFHDAVVFHSRKIRKKEHPFSALANPENNKAFMQELSDFIEGSSVTVIAAAINKTKHKGQYVSPEDPYNLSLQFCLERLYGHVKQAGADKLTFCIFEERGPPEDKALAKRFEEVCSGSNRWGCKLPFRAVFANKLANLQGLQIADLLAYPIAKHVIDPETPRKDWQIVEKKLRSGPKGYMGWGLKVFP